MKIEIWSDIVCPFCYIGKRRFEQALASFPHRDTVEIIWRSFQLNPHEVDRPEKDVYSHLADMKGMSLEWSRNAHDNLVQQARALGLDYRFDLAKISNTIKAHELIQLAKTKGKGDEMEERLFRAYFTDGITLSNIDQLTTVAEEVGLDAQEVRAALNEATYRAAVSSDIELARSFGISGVPFFVFDRKYAVSGAQDPAVFLATMEKAHAAGE